MSMSVCLSVFFCFSVGLTGCTSKFHHLSRYMLPEAMARSSGGNAIRYVLPTSRFVQFARWRHQGLQLIREMAEIALFPQRFAPEDKFLQGRTTRCNVRNFAWRRESEGTQKLKKSRCKKSIIAATR